MSYGRTSPLLSPMVAHILIAPRVRRRARTSGDVANTTEKGFRRRAARVYTAGKKAKADPTLQVSPFRRGKTLTCIYTHERPDLCRELPNWMFDEAYCVAMTLGPPQISIDGLNQLAAVLALLGAPRSTIVTLF